MAKYFKHILLSCLVVCMAVCVGIFSAACGDPDSGTTVKVTVQLPDDSAATGVRVQLCSENGENLMCLPFASVDSNGTATVDYSECSDTTIFAVHLYDIPAGYKYVDESGEEYAIGEGRLIDITKSKSFTIKLVDEAASASVYVG